MRHFYVYRTWLCDELGVRTDSLRSDCSESVHVAHRIINDVHHLNHKLSERLPSGQRLRSIKARTKRLSRSVFSQAERFSSG